MHPPAPALAKMDDTKFWPTAEEASSSPPPREPCPRAHVPSKGFAAPAPPTPPSSSSTVVRCRWFVTCKGNSVLAWYEVHRVLAEDRGQVLPCGMVGGGNRVGCKHKTNRTNKTTVGARERRSPRRIDTTPIAPSGCCIVHATPLASLRRTFHAIN